MSAVEKPKYKRRDIGLHLIKMDKNLQSRAEMSTDHQKALSEAIEGTQRYLAPIVLFFDGKFYWLADGWHRVMAYRAMLAAYPHLKNVPAFVYQGTYRDALVYSTGANNEFSLKRTVADKMRAIRMLLVLPDWNARSNQQIADQTHTSNHLVQKVRDQFHVETKTLAPDYVIGSDGSRRPVPKKGGQAQSRAALSKKLTEAHAGQVPAPKLSVTRGRLVDFFGSRSVYLEPIPASGNVFQLAVYRTQGFLLCELNSKTTTPTGFATAVGTILLGSGMASCTGKPIILCDDTFDPSPYRDAARKHQVEFMGYESAVETIRQFQAT